MTRFAIISDHDDLYQKMIDKLQNDTDYQACEIMLDISTKDVRRNKKNFSDVDVVCVLSQEKSEVIIKLLKYAVPYEKIVTCQEVDEISKFSEIIHKIYRNGIVCYSLGEDAVPSDIRMDEVNYDYIRFRTLSLVIDQIKNKGIKGNLAEVGVYQGDFARWLNYCMEDKVLYLFDTFEGFHGKDVNEELALGASSELAGIMGTGFKNTSPEYVLSRMKKPEMCRVYKGYFPESAEGVDDRFCFVSLDTDLYRPTKEGLCYFWPKLSGGGVFLCMITIPLRVWGYIRLWMDSVRKMVLHCYPSAISTGAVL